MGSLREDTVIKGGDTASFDPVECLHDMIEVLNLCVCTEEVET